MIILSRQQMPHTSIMGCHILQGRDQLIQHIPLYLVTHQWNKVFKIIIVTMDIVLLTRNLMQQDRVLAQQMQHIHRQE